MDESRLGPSSRDPVERERPEDPGRFLTPREVARLVGVSPTTVTRWAREGKLRCKTTLGGHRRFEQGVVHELRKRLDLAASVLHT